MGDSAYKMLDGDYTSSSAPPSIPVADLKALVERSISAWQTIHYVAPDAPELEQSVAINRHAQRLRSYKSLEDVLDSLGYWFFQLRESFLRQTVFLKWDPTRLEEYVLLPIDYGFANNRNCFFISHYWRTRENPDPEAIDLVQFQQDLQDEDWSYAWVDWTCMPQVPRTEPQQRYFRRMLRFIPMLVRDCGLAWRFPDWEPRGWVLMEIAEYVINHKAFVWTDDNRRFINHVMEMCREGVKPVIERHGYKCTSNSDLDLIIGWLELLVLLGKLVPDVWQRHQALDRINSPYVGSFSETSTGLYVDKAAGVISHQGKTYSFTPIYRLTSDW